MTMNARSRQLLMDEVVATVGGVLLGKETQIRLALACVLAQGHLLIEDLPGMGKTTLAHGLATVLGLSFSRIQFTSDLLPADILGVSIFDSTDQVFRFHPGPVFTQLLLADEINRTTPKTQSALLEAMGEGQVTVEGRTRLLPQPFFVIATQNPVSQGGTFSLPESQQDRFTMCLSLGYPDLISEKKMLIEGDPRTQLEMIEPRVNTEQLLELQFQAAHIHVADAVADYLLRLVHHTRSTAAISCGLSPRASLSALQCARAWAMMDGRDYVVPEDIQAVFPAVSRHRLHGVDPGQGDAMVEEVLGAVDVL